MAKIFILLGYQATKLRLRRLVTMDISEKDKGILFLEDKVYQLKMQVSILQKRIQKRQKKPRYTLRKRLFILWHIETFGIKRFGLKDTPTAPRSPWQNPMCERVIGTLRRECLDHMIILSDKHLYNILHEYIFEYYNVSRTHMSLEKDSPKHRPIQKDGKVVSKPILGGLHHVYSRVA